MSKPKSIDTYMEVGAYMRLCKTLMCKTIVEFAKIAPKSEVHKLENAYAKFLAASNYAENEMFRYHKEVPGIYNDFFFGATNQPPRNEIDSRALGLARLIASNLVWEDQI